MPEKKNDETTAIRAGSWVAHESDQPNKVVGRSFGQLGVAARHSPCAQPDTNQVGRNGHYRDRDEQEQRSKSRHPHHRVHECREGQQDPNRSDAAAGVVDSDRSLRHFDNVPFPVGSQPAHPQKKRRTHNSNGSQGRSKRGNH